MIDHVVARTAYAEARGEGLDGMAAVINVIYNRAARSSWWGHDPISVCLKPWQFSCWNESDPQSKTLREVPLSNPLLQDAIALEGAAARGELRDRTGGADHYFADYIATPRWAEGREPTRVIGRHRFYKIGPNPNG